MKKCFPPGGPCARIAVSALCSWAAVLRRKRVLVIGLLLFALTAWVFLPSIGNGFVSFDDPDYVTANPHVQDGLNWDSVKWAFLTPVSCNWHPLTVLSHMVDCQLFALKPWGHHLTSLLLHAVNTVLVFLLLRFLTGSLWQSALVAALFGLHPLHVESVALVAERKDVLSTCFGLLALLFYVRYAQAMRGVGSLDGMGIGG